MNKFKKILVLEFGTEAVRYEQLQDLAIDNKCVLDWISYPMTGTLSQIREQFRTADALLSFGSMLIDDSDIASLARESISQGKRLLIEAGAYSTSINEFAIDYDMAINSNKLANFLNSVGDDPRVISVKLEHQTNPTSKALMRSAQELIVHGPRQVWYGPEAEPLLSTAPNAAIIDRGDNIVEADQLDPREFTFSSVWPTGDPAQHRVMLLAASILVDPFAGVTGKVFTGIQSNRPFVVALLKWLNYELPTEELSENAILQGLVASIEIALHDIMKSVLKSTFGSNWWYEGIPESIRVNASKMVEESKGELNRDECLYLINYKTIIEKNWTLFQSHFSQEGSGKSHSLDWIEKLNGIRNRLSHPIRSKRQPFTDEERRFVCEIKDRVIAVLSICRSGSESR